MIIVLFVILHEKINKNTYAIARRHWWRQKKKIKGLVRLLKRIVVVREVHVGILINNDASRFFQSHYVIMYTAPAVI